MSLRGVQLRGKLDPWAVEEDGVVGDHRNLPMAAVAAIDTSRSIALDA
jgi:hypothetical protein